jgi:hypothetical protein
VTLANDVVRSNTQPPAKNPCLEAKRERCGVLLEVVGALG